MVTQNIAFVYIFLFSDWFRVHSFGQPNQPYQPYQPVFPKRIEPVDGRFWFRAFA